MILEIADLATVQTYVPDVAGNRSSVHPWAFDFLPVNDGDFEALKKTLPASDRARTVRQAVLRKYVKAVRNLKIRIGGELIEITSINDLLEKESLLSPILANEVERLYQAVLEGASVAVAEKNG